MLIFLSVDRVVIREHKKNDSEYTSPITVYSPQPGYLPEVLRTIPPLNDREFIDEVTYFSYS